MIHELKISTNYFNDVISGRKTFEVRLKDRPFKKGDLLALNEFDQNNKYYTGNSCIVYIDYILDDEKYCKENHIIMSIKPRVIRKLDEPYNFTATGNYTVPIATEGISLEVNKNDQ